MKDVWAYFEAHEKTITDMGLSTDDLEYVALEGSGDSRGRVWGRVGYTERTFMSISERVDVDVTTGDFRVEYAYYVIVDGAEVWGEERDPSHVGIEVHRHDRDHTRFPSEGVTLKEALERGWDTVGQEESWELEDRG